MAYICKCNRCNEHKMTIQEKWELGALLCIGIAGIILYVVVQTNLQETHLIDGKVLPRNEAQVNNGY